MTQKTNSNFIPFPTPSEAKPPRAGGQTAATEGANQTAHRAVCA
jgi:hypothetical protein